MGRKIYFYKMLLSFKFSCLLLFFFFWLRASFLSSGFLNVVDTHVENDSNISEQIGAVGIASTMTVTIYKNRRLRAIGNICTKRDISISQSRDSSSGIPEYIVQIVNTCMSGCAPSNIHVHCGWFASAKIVNPKVFRRVAYDDCVVNGGRPLKSSQVIRFTYDNSFMYPLSFKSAIFC